MFRFLLLVNTIGGMIDIALAITLHTALPTESGLQSRNEKLLSNAKIFLGLNIYNRFNIAV